MNRGTAGVVTSLSNWLDGIDTHTVRQFYRGMVKPCLWGMHRQFSNDYKVAY